MLCCPCTTDPSSRYRDVSFPKGWGEYGSSTRDTFLKARRHSEALSPPLNPFTLFTARIHTSRYFYQLNPAHRARVSDSRKEPARSSPQEHGHFFLRIHIWNMLHNLQTVAMYKYHNTPFFLKKIPAWKQCSRNVSRAAHSESSLWPRQLPICNTPTTRNSKLVLANWLASSVSKQSSHCLELVVLAFSLSPYNCY